MLRITLSTLTLLIVQQYVQYVATESSYISASATCTTCSCYYRAGQSLILNCTARAFKQIPAGWPPHSRRLTVSFNFNNLTTLPQLPESNADEVHISFSHCGLKEIQSAAFIDIGNLTFLDISWNKLTGEALHSDIFRGRFNTREYEPLIKLTTLDISHNDIHVLSPRSLEHLPNLKTLYLNNNPLKALTSNTVSAISMTSYLQYLDISSSTLEYISEDALARLKQLNTLLLWNNTLTKIPESIASASENLHHLDVSENDIKELNDESFIGLRNLTFLNISSMPLLETIHAGTFEQLNNLQILQCSNNPRLTVIDKDAFRDLKDNWPIKELNISNNSLQQLSQKLLPWDQVLHLDISGNPWRCDCQLYHTMKRIQSIFREQNTHYPVCYYPPWLSGISIYQTPYKVCEKQQLNGTLNGILQIIYKDDSKKSKLSGTVSRRPKILWISFVCGGLVVALTIMGIVATALLKHRQRKFNEMYSAPIRYTIAKPLE